MHHVWAHTFYDCLKIDPTECRILLTDPPLNPTKNRETMVETMFETWGFAGAFIQVQAVLYCLLYSLVFNLYSLVFNLCSLVLICIPLYLI